MGYEFLTELEDVDCVALVRAAQAGDRECLNKLCSCFYHSAMSVAMSRLRHWQDAEDVVQIVFIAVSTKIHQLRDPTLFEHWMRRAVIRVAINARVRRMRTVPMTDELLQSIADKCMSDPLCEAERHAWLHEAVSQLTDSNGSENPRLVMECFYFHGLSVQQTADQLGLPEGTVKRLMCVGRRKLAGAAPADL